MNKLFFITAMMLNLETGEVSTKYQQMVVFYKIENCHNYIDQNFTYLKNGFQIYMDYNNIKGELQSLSCTGLTKEDIKRLELDIEEEDDTLST